jgi:HEAT repeat protein
MRTLRSMIALLLVVQSAWAALAEDPPGLASLLRDLRSTDAVKKRQAASAIGAQGPAARSAVPTLLSVLEKDRDALLRRNIAEALGNIGGDTRQIVPALSKSLRDGDPDVVAAAALALSKFGKSSVPALKRALGETDPLLRKNAAVALGKIGPPAKEAVPELISAFNSENQAGRRRDNSIKAALAEALGAIGPDAKSAIPALESAIEARNVDREFRRVVNEALRKIKKS